MSAEPPKVRMKRRKKRAARRSKKVKKTKKAKKTEKTRGSKKRKKPSTKPMSHERKKYEPSEEKKKKEEDKCPICLDEVKIQGKIDSCNHKMCYECIERWSKETNRCPICKSRFRSIKKIENGEEKNIDEIQIREDRNLRPDFDIEQFLVDEQSRRRLPMQFPMSLFFNSLIPEPEREDLIHRNNEQYFAQRMMQPSVVIRRYMLPTGGSSRILTPSPTTVRLRPVSLSSNDFRLVQRHHDEDEDEDEEEDIGWRTRTNFDAFRNESTTTPGVARRTMVREVERDQSGNVIRRKTVETIEFDV